MKQFWEAVRKHTTAGHTVGFVAVGNDVGLYVEKTVDGKRYGPDGLVIKDPSSDIAVAQMTEYLEFTLERLMEPVRPQWEIGRN